MPVQVQELLSSLLSGVSYWPPTFFLRSVKILINKNLVMTSSGIEEQSHYNTRTTKDNKNYLIHIYAIMNCFSIQIIKSLIH